MWKTVAASVRGTSHEKNDTPCQDASAFRVVIQGEQSILLIALADGAGSKKFSDQGSAFVVENWLDAAENALIEGDDLDEKALVGLADFVASNLSEYVSGKEGEVGDYACTLLAAVVCEGRTVFFQVGDGAWVHRVNGAYWCPTWPYQGEYAGETVFLTSKTAFANYQTATVADVDAVAGFSDGLERLALNLATKEASPKFFESMFNSLANNPVEAIESNLKAFLNSDRLNERTDDDKTLVLTVKVPDAHGN
jgi:hypothetical protein